VAIGRAIIRNPRVFLFDEPLSNLDAALRVQMRLEIARLHQRLGATMVYVTHDQVEAMTLADKIVVLNDGRIEQVGSPIELYNAPANRFVAQFIGSPRMNFFPAELSASHARRELILGAARIVLGDQIRAVAGEPITVGVRPEHLAIGNDAPTLFEAEIAVVERLGSETIVYLDTPGSAEPIAIKVAATRDLRLGERVPVTVTDGVIHLFNADGGGIGRASTVQPRG
jgi:multiple sugar transport system ATP-binding protein